MAKQMKARDAEEADLRKKLAAIEKEKAVEEAKKIPAGILAAIEDGYTLTGVRLSKPGSDEGHTIVFEQPEADKVMATIKLILEARAGV